VIAECHNHAFLHLLFSQPSLGIGSYSTSQTLICSLLTDKSASIKEQHCCRIVEARQLNVCNGRGEEIMRL
jgi:hypothetical protein